MDLKKAGEVIRNEEPLRFWLAKDGTCYLYGKELEKSGKPSCVQDGCIAIFPPRVGTPTLVQALKVVLVDFLERHDKWFGQPDGKTIKIATGKDILAAVDNAMRPNEPEDEEPIFDEHGTQKGFPVEEKRPLG